MTLPDGLTVRVPMRVVANGDGSEAIFTIFRLPGVDDAAFAADIGGVERDLAALTALKAGLEVWRQPGPSQIACCPNKPAALSRGAAAGL